MSRKVIQVGNSLGVTIPSELLESLGLELGSEVEIDIDSTTRQLVIRPVAEKMHIDPEFDARLQAFIRDYRPMLESLARR